MESASGWDLHQIVADRVFGADAEVKQVENGLPFLLGPSPAPPCKRPHHLEPAVRDGVWERQDCPKATFTVASESMKEGC
jgi:hypothetical protein